MKRNSIQGLWMNSGMLVVFLVMFVTLSLTVDSFFTSINMLGLALSVSMVGMVACTMLFCMASGDFDLSIESIVACAGVVAVVVVNSTGSVGKGIAAGVAVGTLVGVFNGLVISVLKINALITTLATMQIVRGLGFIASDGVAVGARVEAFFTLGIGQYLAIPYPIWITVFCFILFGILLNRTTFGRNTLAIGGNEEAARLAGIPVTRTKVIIFTLQGMMAGFAGVVLASRITSGQPNTSQGFSLDVISACVLGGVSLSGGVGTMTGVIVGVLIMGCAQNAMNLLNVETFYQYVARGVILLAAVLFDQMKQRLAAKVS